MRWIAASVEAGYDGQRFVGFDDKQQRVGKATKQGATDALVNNVELPRIGAHPLEHGVNRCAETSA
jgi:hypothetical protein